MVVIVIEWLDNMHGVTRKIYIGKVCKVPVDAHFISEGQVAQPPAVVFSDTAAGGKNLLNLG